MRMLTSSLIQLSLMLFIKIKPRLIAAIGFLLVGSFVTAAPSVSENIISWPDDGWYQVQDQATHTEICGGGRSCDVGPGIYVVINHSTGERFNDITVVRDDDLTNGVIVTGNTISWPDDGWYQVQDQATHTEVCGGGRSCDVEPGVYVVINHSTGERFNNITVVGNVGLTNGVIVTGNTISWPDDGWYQVQDQATHTEVCGGGRSCDVEPGIYVVINHSTGERFNNITVVGDDDHTDGMSATAPEPVQATLELVPDKTFRISWPLSTAAQFYRVFENPDGISGFTDVSAELDATTTTFDHRVALFARVNAQYFVQSCNDQGCVDSEPVMVTGTLDNAIGYFKASNTSPEDIFGRSISLNADGNTMAIGAMFEDSAATGVNGNQNDRSAGTSGAVFVFVRINGAWQQQAYIKASNTDSEDFFGIAVSLSADGNTLAVGATGEASSASGINSDQLNNSAENSGAVYVFERNDGNWRQEAYLKASNTGSGDSFGLEVSISADGGALAVGAPGKFDDSGAVYVFERRDGNWQQQAYLIASNPDFFDYFGAAVSLNGDTLAVGARGERSAATGIDGDQNDDSATASGAVYVFVRNSGDWQQQAYIKPSNTDSGDAFGGKVSLSVDGNTLAVGATGERSAATGVDGDQNDDSARSSGAVYVFVRDNSDWQQQAYIKAGNTDPGDAFGAGVSLSADGNTIAIGAQFEDSSSIGVNGNEDDDAAASAGAAYVFEYISGAWQQQAYIKASNTDLDDYFGGAVNLSADGKTLAVGAYQESSASIGVNGDQTDNTFVRSGAVYLY